MINFRFLALTVLVLCLAWSTFSQEGEEGSAPPTEAAAPVEEVVVAAVPESAPATEAPKPAAPKGEVIKLTDASFDVEVDDNEQWFVKFYAPWCGHCQHLAPTWEKLAEEIGGGSSIKIAEVDATVDEKTAAKFDVQGYPTLVLVADGLVYSYEGRRNLEDLKKFAEGGYKEGQSRPRPARVAGGAAQEPAKEVEDLSIVLTDETFDEKVTALKADTDSEEVWLIEFYAPWCGACKALAPSWTKLAAEFKDDPNIRIAKIDATANPKAKDRMAVNGYPSIFLFKKGRYYTFIGNRVQGVLAAYVKGEYEKTKSFPVPAKDARLQQEDEQDPDSDVVVLKDSNFEELVKMGFESDWFIEFYAVWCGHCKQLRPVWELVATELKPKGIKVGKIEANKNPEAAKRFAVTGFPTLVVVKQGMYYDYSGARTLSALVEFASGGYKNSTTGGAPIQWVKTDRPSDVITLADANFEHLTQSVTGQTTGDWLIDFYAEGCHHCTALKPVWEFVATELKGKVNVATIEVLSNPETQKRFDIMFFPTIALLSQGKMYYFNGTRDVKTLTIFAGKNGGAFARAEVRSVPGLLSISDRIGAHADYYLREAYRLYQFNALVTVGLFLSGLVGGSVVTLVVCWIFLCAGRGGATADESGEEASAASTSKKSGKAKKGN